MRSSAVAHFKRNKFNGLKVQWRPFSDEVITNLYFTVGQDESRILTTTWPIDPVTNLPIVGEELSLLHEPPNISLPDLLSEYVKVTKLCFVHQQHWKSSNEKTRLKLSEKSTKGFYRH